jgi:hypothetical protein
MDNLEDDQGWQVKQPGTDNYPNGTGSIGLSCRRTSSARGVWARWLVTMAPKSGRPLRRCSAFKRLPLAAMYFLHK